MKWNLPITLYTHAHSSILKKKIEYLLSRQLREMMCKRLLGVHKQPRTERAIHPEKIKIKKTMKRSDKQQSSGWVHAVCHTQRGVKRRSRSNHWLDSVVQQRAGSVLMLSARYIFQRLNGGNPKNQKSHAPSMLHQSNVFWCGDRHKLPPKSPSKKRDQGLLNCLCTAHDEICGRIKSESLRRCHKFTFPWRVKEKRSKIKYKKKTRERILITITTREEPRESGAHVS